MLCRVPMTGWAIGCVPKLALSNSLYAVASVVVLVLDVLVQDDLALALELGFGEAALLHDVSEHLQEAPRVSREPAHVIRGVILVGVGVDLGAEHLCIEVDLLAVAAARALERHVLDEVADAAQAPALVAAAGAHEHAGARTVEVRQPDRDDTHAVGERRRRGVGVAAEILHRRRSAPRGLTPRPQTTSRCDRGPRRSALSRRLGDERRREVLNGGAFAIRAGRMSVRMIGDVFGTLENLAALLAAVLVRRHGNLQYTIDPF